MCQSQNLRGVSDSGISDQLIQSSLFTSKDCKKSRGLSEGWFLTSRIDSMARLSTSPFSQSVKSREWPIRNENLRIWRDSIIDGDRLLRRAVIVSLADENTRSHGTAEPWMGKMSMAMRKSVGYRCRLSYRSSIRHCNHEGLLLTCQYPSSVDAGTLSERYASNSASRLRPLCWGPQAVVDPLNLNPSSFAAHFLSPQRGGPKLPFSVGSYCWSFVVISRSLVWYMWLTLPHSKPWPEFCPPLRRGAF